MYAHSGRFDHPEGHHAGWFRVFHVGTTFEIWFGRKYILIGLR